MPDPYLGRFALGLLASKSRTLMYAGVKIQLLSCLGSVSSQGRGRPRIQPFISQMTIWHLLFCQQKTAAGARVPGTHVSRGAASRGGACALRIRTLAGASLPPGGTWPARSDGPLAR